MGVKKKMTGNMTSGNPFKLILLFAIPLYIGNMFQQLYSTVDTLIVSRTLGVDAMSAVGVTTSFVLMVVGFGIGICVGLSVKTAQYYGASDIENVKKSFATSIMITIFFTFLITLVGVLICRPVLELMQTPSDIIDRSYNYLIVIFYGVFASMIYNFYASMIRALGDSKTPLYFLILASIINIVLDYVLILNVGLDVEGAGYATVISQLISGVLCMLYTNKKYKVLKISKEDFAIDKKFIKEHLDSAIPMGLQYSIIAIGIIFVQFILNGYGTEYIAAYTSAGKVELILMQVHPAIGAAVVTFVAQNFGAKKYDRIVVGVKNATQITLIYGAIAFLILLFLGTPLIKFIVGDVPQHIYENGQIYLNFCAFTLWTQGMIFVYRSALQGIGRSDITVTAGVLELGSRCVIAMILPRFIGYNGICLASPITWILTGLFVYIYYKINIKNYTIT